MEKEFVLIFRTSADPHAKVSPEQLQERMNWFENVGKQNLLADKGNRVTVDDSKTVRSRSVASGPYLNGKEFVTGYMVVKTKTIEDAIGLAQSNPILKGGGSVEIRPVLGPPSGK